MKNFFKIFTRLVPLCGIIAGLLLSSNIPSAHAVSLPTAEESGSVLSIVGALNKAIVPISGDCTMAEDFFIRNACAEMQNLDKYVGGGFTKDESGNVYSPGILGVQQKFVSLLYDNQISSQEYIADIMNNIGIPTVSRAYAQGTGYNAMKPFLEFWKVFRNLAYSLYIVMFVVVGIMIMLRTKVNAQTIITIQTALPNLLITLILITFSYAIVGFMIDLMYFLIYFVVYLISSVGIIDAPKMITRLMSYSAWSVIFEGRNSIISAISSSIGGVLWGLGTGALGFAGAVVSMVSPMYLIVAVAFVIAMLKLMLALVKSYVMIIVQTITAPIQILMNAMPGSKAFSEWLKKTASYLIPFPVAACMFIFAAILVGNPTDKTLLGGSGANPFGVNEGADIYQNRENMWLPPFTLTESKLASSQGAADILTLIGFFVFLMTPAAVKMAQEWLQVKESPYASEAVGGFMGIASTPIKGLWSVGSHKFQEHQQRKLYAEIGKNMQAPDSREGSGR
ncbi:MAG: hypothetical protein ABII21_03840 [bacterium]